MAGVGGGSGGSGTKRADSRPPGAAAAARGSAGPSSGRSAPLWGLPRIIPLGLTGEPPERQPSGAERAVGGTGGQPQQARRPGSGGPEGGAPPWRSGDAVRPAPAKQVAAAAPSAAPWPPLPGGQPPWRHPETMPHPASAPTAPPPSPQRAPSGPTLAPRSDAAAPLGWQSHAAAAPPAPSLPPVAVGLGLEP
ncbi:MAG: hypothetical protein J3K34DRAFT_434747, partial [Monoraphidium minutum]